LHWTGENSETDSDGEVIISTLQVNSVENRNKAIFVAPKVDGVTGGGNRRKPLTCRKF
jgi:hypothetical protein